MWSRARVLLVMPPILPMTAYIFLAAPESNAEIETLVRSWGYDEIELLPDGSMRIGAVRLAMWNAQVMDIPVSKAVVTREDGAVTAVVLCRDLDSAGDLARSRRHQGPTARVKPLTCHAAYSSFSLRWA